MLRLDGPQSMDAINQKHVKITSGKPNPAFIPNMVKRGWLVKYATGHYGLTSEGFALLQKNNTYDETMAQPRTLSMFDRGLYRGEGLSYRGKK